VACNKRSAAAARSPFQLQVARKFEPPVGNQIAGEQEQARGHFWEPHLSLPGARPRLDQGRSGNPSIEEFFRKMDARVKPAHGR
jgi:hypothetical protein